MIFGRADILDIFFPDDDYFIELRAIKEGKRPIVKFYKYKHELLLDSEWIKTTNKERNIYIGMGKRRSSKGGSKENIASISVLWADIDGDEKKRQRAIDKAMQILPPTVIVNSGGGIHLFWRLKETIIINDFKTRLEIETCLKRSALSLGADISVCELARMIRFVDTRNLKYLGHPLCQIISLNPERQYSLLDFDVFEPVECVQEAEGNKVTNPSVLTSQKAPGDTKTVRRYITPKIDRPCIIEYEKYGTVKGYRNKVVFFIACEYCRRGIPLEEAKTRLIEVNTKNKPPMTEAEMAVDLFPAIKIAYKQPKSYSCKHPILKAKCIGIEKCEYYSEFYKVQEIVIKGHSEDLFQQYGYEKRLSGFEIKVYKAIIELEKSRKVGVGGTILTSMRQILALLLDDSLTPMDILRAIRKLQSLSLIVYIAGNYYKRKGSVIYRVIPIPTLNNNLLTTTNYYKHIISNNKIK